MNQNNQLPLKYLGYTIVCEEVPNEISLAFNISGCPYKCEGCHSKYLWEYNGRYLKEDILKILSQYEKLITCVCFMGGDQNITELSFLCNIVKNMFKLKTCIYSGSKTIDKFLDMIDDGLLDYLKLGPYIQSLGGLNNPNTNQTMYKIDDINNINDITYMFQKKYQEVIYGQE